MGASCFIVPAKTLRSHRFLGRAPRRDHYVMTAPAGYRPARGKQTHPDVNRPAARGRPVAAGHQPAGPGTIRAPEDHFLETVHTVVAIKVSPRCQRIYS